MTREQKLEAARKAWEVALLTKDDRWHEYRLAVEEAYDDPVAPEPVDYSKVPEVIDLRRAAYIDGLRDGSRSISMGIGILEAVKAAQRRYPMPEEAGDG